MPHRSNVSGSIEYFLENYDNLSRAPEYVCRLLTATGASGFEKHLIGGPCGPSQSEIASAIQNDDFLHAALSLSMVLHQIETGAMPFSMSQLIRDLVGALPPQSAKTCSKSYENLTEKLRVVPHVLYHLVDVYCLLRLEPGIKVWEIESVAQLPWWACIPTKETREFKKFGALQLDLVAEVVSHLTSDSKEVMKGHLTKVVRPMLEGIGLVKKEKNDDRHAQNEPLRATPMLLSVTKPLLGCYYPTIGALFAYLNPDEMALLAHALWVLRGERSAADWHFFEGAPKKLVRGIAYAGRDPFAEGEEMKGIDPELKPLAMDLSHCLHMCRVWHGASEILFLGVLSLNSLAARNFSSVRKTVQWGRMVPICEKLYRRALEFVTPRHPWDANVELVNALATGRKAIADRHTELE